MCDCWTGEYYILDQFGDEYVSRDIPDIPNITIVRKLNSKHPHMRTHWNPHYRAWYNAQKASDLFYFARMDATQAWNAYLSSDVGRKYE